MSRNQVPSLISPMGYTDDELLVLRRLAHDLEAEQAYTHETSWIDYAHRLPTGYYPSLLPQDLTQNTKKGKLLKEYLSSTQPQKCMVLSCGEVQHGFFQAMEHQRTQHQERSCTIACIKRGCTQVFNKSGNANRHRRKLHFSHQDVPAETGSSETVPYRKENISVNAERTTLVRTKETGLDKVEEIRSVAQKNISPVLHGYTGDKAKEIFTAAERKAVKNSFVLSVEQTERLQLLQGVASQTNLTPDEKRGVLRLVALKTPGDLSLIPFVKFEDKSQ